MDVRDKYFLLRKRKKISLKCVAEFVGVHFSMLSHYERSERNLNPTYEMKYRQFIDNY